MNDDCFQGLSPFCCNETMRAVRFAKRTSERTTKPSRDVFEAQWFAVGAYHERRRNRGDLVDAQQKSRVFRTRHFALSKSSLLAQVMANGPPGEPVAPVIGTGAKTYTN